MAVSTPQQQRLDQIDVLRAQAGRLTSQSIPESANDEVRAVCLDLDGVVESLTMRSVPKVWRTVLAMADTVIKNATCRLSTVERALKVNSEAMLCRQFVEDQ